MITEHEALKLALEAFDYIRNCETDVASQTKYGQAAEVIKEALAQPEQEQSGFFSRESMKAHSDLHVAQPEQKPVAYIHRNEYNEYRLEPHDNFDIRSIPFNVDVPLFKAPQRKPLTDEEIKPRTDAQIEATFKKCGGRWNGDHWVIEDADLHPFVRTIEGPELNTLRAISDEYNAWIKHHAAGHSYDDFLAKRTAAHGIKE